MKHPFLQLRSFLIVVVFIFSSDLLSAQSTRKSDLIIKRDSTKIEALIIEVNELTIRYKKYSDKEGPDFSLAKRDVASVIYGNGEVEQFAAAPEIYFDEAPLPVTPYESDAPANRYRRGSVQSLDTRQLNFNYSFYLKKAAKYKTMSVVGASLGSLMTIAGIITASAAVRDMNAAGGSSSQAIDSRFAGGVMLTTMGICAGIPLTIIGVVKHKSYNKKALLVKEELQRRKAPLTSIRISPGFDPVSRSAGVRLSMVF